MSRLRSNHQRGKLTASIVAGDTSIPSTGFANLPVVTAPDYMMITLDPDGNPEIVKVTAHTSSATSVTVVRAQEGTSARSHNSSTTWRHVPTSADWGFVDRVFNVQEFLALGDGSADDTTPVQNAINAANSAGGGTVHFPKTANYYKVTTALTLYSNVRLTGDGYSSRIDISSSDIGCGGSSLSRVEITGIRFTGSTARMLKFSLPTNLRIHDCWISGATADNGSTYSAGIYLDQVTDAWIYNNECTGNGIGASANRSADILAYSTGNNVRVHITDNKATSTATHFSIAVYNPQYCAVRGNTTSGAISDATNNSGYGILFYDGGSFVSKHSIIEGNQVGACGGSGIYVADVGVRVVGNDCESNAATQTDGSLPVGGIAINNSSHSPRAVVSANTVMGSGKDGIVLASDGPRAAVTGNTIYNCTGNGIQIRGDNRYSTVTGNTIDACANAGIFNTTSTVGLVITSNTVTNTTGTSIGIYINPSSGATSRCVVSNNVADANGGHGIAIVGASAGALHTINGNTCINNGAGSAGNYAGIYFSSTDTVCSGNVSLNSGTSNQKYGVQDASAAGTNNVISNNDVSSNVTAGVLSSTNTLAYDNGDTQMPWLVDVDVLASATSNTAWDTLVANSGYLNGGYRTTNGTQNATVTFTVVLGAGTWQIEVLTDLGSNQGIITFQIDGSSVGTFDTYAAGGSSNNRHIVTGVTVAAPGKHSLTLTMATKNASSSNYYGVINGLHLLRTA